MQDPSSPGARAKAVRKELRKTQAEMAEFLGLAIGTWQKLERDEVVPSGETLLSFKQAGINPGWVLSGLGPRRLGEDDAYLYEKNALIDADLLVDIKKVVANVHKTAGITLHDADLDRKAITHYNEYMIADTDLRDAEEMALWLKLLEKRLQREVAAAREAPGTGKREAS